MNKCNFLIQVTMILIICITSLQLHSQTPKTDNKKTLEVSNKSNTEKLLNDPETGKENKTNQAKTDLTDAKKKTDTKDQKDTISDDQKKFDKISQTLEYGIQKDRKIAVNMIKEVNDESLRKQLLAKLASIVLNDADMEIRKSAVTALVDFKSTENSAAVINALDDDSDDVKIAACYSIGKMKISESKMKLMEILKKQDLTAPSNFTDAVIIALGDLNASEIIDFAVEGVKNIKNSKIIRERLLLFIGKCGSPAQKDFLLSLYKDDEEDMTIRSYAVKSIANLKINEAAPSIKEVIKEIDSYNFNKKKRYYNLYMQSVTALVELGDSDSIPLLMNSIRSDNADVRYRAVNLIKEFDDERTIDILKYKMENDPSGKVRRAARRALEDKGLVEKDTKSKETPDADEKNEDTE